MGLLQIIHCGSFDYGAFIFLIPSKGGYRDLNDFGRTADMLLGIWMNRRIYVI